MGSLRIAMFSDSALPILNGVSISLDALVTELRNQGHSVHLYAPRCPGHRDLDPNTIRFRAVGTPWAPSYPIAYPPFIRKLRQFRRNEYDVIHTHTPFVMGMVGLRWAESHELPIVSTYHTLYDRYAHYLTCAPKRYVRFRIAKHTNFYYNRVNRVVTPSDAALKWLRRHSVSTPASVIPTGIRGRGFWQRAESRQDLGISADQRVLLYVGRLAKEKNLGLLMDMARIVFKSEGSARLWLVGDGPYRDDCIRMVRDAGIGDRVKFVGFVPRTEVDRYYAAADLFVFSSVSETQGLVVQEAMAHGLPAVAVGGGGAAASIVYGLNGYVVKNDPKAFARMVQDLLNDDALLDRMGTAAERSVREQTIPYMAKGILDVYDRAILGKPAEDRSLARI